MRRSIISLLAIVGAIAAVPAAAVPVVGGTTAVTYSAANPAGAAIVNATGQIRQIVMDGITIKRWHEIVTQREMPARTVQVQRP